MPEVLPVYTKYLPLLGLEIIPLPSAREINKLAGTTSEKDIPVLASAIMGKADFLVTGDRKDFIHLTGNYPFKILTPSEFLDSILPEVLKALESEG